MKIRRRTQIEIRTESFLSLKSSGRSIYAHCGLCRQRVRIIEIDRSSRFFNEVVQTLFRLLEAGRMHLVETGGKSLVVCMNSLREPDKQATN